MDKNITSDHAIGEQICHWRKLRGWSQRELARRANIANGALSQVELGHSSPAVNTLQKVAKALGISLQALMFGEPCVPCEIMQSNDAAKLANTAFGACSTYQNTNGDSVFYRVQLLSGQTFQSAVLLPVQKLAQAPIQSSIPIKSLSGGFTAHIYEGNCTLFIAGIEYALTRGDALWLMPNASFELVANSALDAVIWPA